MAQLPINQFLQAARNTPVIDVRSPGEFEKGHIPGAVNIPLFTNEERAKVGTRYKQIGPDAALLLGLDIVGPKMSGFVKQARKLAPGGDVLVHCWRGGMRSGSFAWLLQTAGMQVNTLQKGYKAYRNEVLRLMGEPMKLIILSGKTGSGKSETLREIARLGEQVVDLETLAHHKGSSFGALGQLPQPSVEQFENDLHRALSQLDFSRRIWLEDESNSIGTVFIPRPLWHQMRQARVIMMDVPKEERIRRLVREYAEFPHSLLENAIMRIRKRMGGQHFSAALAALDAGDYAQVADLTLNYYDKAYLFGLSKRESASISRVEVGQDDPTANARQVLAVASEITPANTWNAGRTP
jgi:tRNA 2-selenouridine synthase